MTHWIVVFLALGLLETADGRHPMCHFHSEVERAKLECQDQLERHALETAGCQGEWSSILCWESAAAGEVVTLFCPPAVVHLFGLNGTLSRNCTEAGWSDIYPSMTTVCMSNSKPDKLVFYMVVKTLYTLGHSLSLIALISSTAILCVFRRLHCTRNYIHLNLFLSFILRAVAVLIKDAILFSHSEHTDCSLQPSLVGCKISLVVFNYFVMANFFWILVEGLYLHTLLLVMSSCNTPLTGYMLIGWGVPLVFVAAWVISRVYLENTECWERDESLIPKRLINWPIMASVILNFFLFVSVIRILIQKLNSSDVGGNNQPHSQYRCLVKSTLLLIPLFGVNYVVFVYLVEVDDASMEEYKILFDLGLGSFLGLVVAILYCFLNTEVQGELRRKWRSVSLKRYVGRECQPHGPHGPPATLNGTDAPDHFPRNARTQSILQTETTML